MFNKSLMNMQIKIMSNKIYEFIYLFLIFNYTCNLEAFKAVKSYAPNSPNAFKRALLQL